MSNLNSEGEESEPKRLTSEILRSGLSQISQTFDGSSYAFTRLNLNAQELDLLSDEVKKYQHLRYIDISENQITSIDYAFQLPFILQFLAQKNRIVSIDYLAREDCYQYLQIADFSSNKIQRLPAIKQPKLRRLNLNNNEIENCDNFEGHANLQILELRGNKLTSCSGLKELPNLKELYLAENQIGNISGLENVPQLKRLHLRKNVVESLDEETLPDLPELEYLNFRESKINNPEEIQKLNKFSNIKKLSVQDTPLTEEYGEKSKLEIIMRYPKLEFVNKEEVSIDDREEAQAEAEERKRKEEEERLEKERLEREAEEKDEEEDA